MLKIKGYGSLHLQNNVVKTLPEELGFPITQPIVLNFDNKIVVHIASNLFSMKGLNMPKQIVTLLSCSIKEDYYSSYH